MTTTEQLKRIDELMAVEVMGAEIVSMADYWGYDHYSKEPYRYQCKDFDYRIGDEGDDTWTPTTDMNQAWECLEKAEQETEWVFSVSSNGYCHAVHGLSGREFDICDTTTPLAICKAILKAKGIDTTTGGA